MSSLPHPALLAIDIQVGLLHGPEAPHAGAETLANINRLSQAARAAGAPAPPVPPCWRCATRARPVAP
ncbi:isochorismatase family protein [Aeromonas rivipollensis]|uniref:isochorismatase family protein n=1 Tax=Aeromonas rivipollensis TaxID=948519 RepID=UPI0038D092A3